ncbi:MAG: hypothetical protein ACC660_02065 [Acidimicrobiales bacterium]
MSLSSVHFGAAAAGAGVLAQTGALAVGGVVLVGLGLLATYVASVRGRSRR